MVIMKVGLGLYFYTVEYVRLDSGAGLGKSLQRMDMKEFKLS